MTGALLEQSWAVQIPGLPKPKGSMKCVGARGRIKHVLVEQVDNKAWRKQVTAAGLLLPVRDLGGPIAITVTFTLPRPPSHYGTGRNAHRLKPDAPTWPHHHGTGDLDKLMRLIADALEDARVFHNDAQIVHGDVWKCYPDTRDCPDRLPEPGAIIRIHPI
jgi:Holliday junction resolvase RusA-like endonuclease